jgi:hypothetical protein
MAVGEALAITVADGEAVATGVGDAFSIAVGTAVGDTAAGEGVGLVQPAMATIKTTSNVAIIKFIFINNQP